MTGIYTFGPFRLDVAAGILFRGAEPVALGQRAVALLHMLVGGAGAPISKDRLIEALFFGSDALAYAGEAERAIDWAERGLRISPFDRLNYVAYHGLAIGHFLRGHYDEAERAARRAVQSVPSFSVSRSLLAAALAKLGRIDEAKAVALEVLALDPSFSASRFCGTLGLPTALAEPMADAWSTAGLPP